MALTEEGPVQRDRYGMSYILGTRNKLEFLKESLPRLIAARQTDEEIVVVDGASTDGSAEYILKFKESGAIDQFITEPDSGEAHGFNKGLLLARGALLKVVSDDDVYDWSKVHECRRFMETRPDIPILSGMAADWDVCAPGKITVQGYIHDFEKGPTAPRFFFNCLPLMIRRCDLPLIGLFRSGFISVDLEFSLRVSGIARVAYVNTPLVVRVYNPQSTGSKRHKEVIEEIKKLYAYYSLMSPFVSADSKTLKLRRLCPGTFRQICSLFGFRKRERPEKRAMLFEPSDIFAKAEAWLAEKTPTRLEEKIFIHSPPSSEFPNRGPGD
jgi:glycosyltransferase involved in cell wall biosynthesis